MDSRRGHQTGSGSEVTFLSNALVKRGVVLVTINHRLGIMGYFAHPALSDAMVRYWINFARAGDPNGEGLTTWPVYDRG